jgi:hypothetical protein
MANPVVAQVHTFAVDSSLEIPSKFIKRVSARAEAMTVQLNQRTEQYIEKLEKQEGKLIRQLSKFDPDIMKGGPLDKIAFSYGYLVLLV